MAQWLYSLGADIHIKNDEAFIYSYSHRNFEIAKWLYSLGVNIRVRDDLAFIYSYNNYNLEISQWLHDLDNKILAENIKDLDNYPEHGSLVSVQNAKLFECILNGTPFPEIEEVDDLIVHSLCYYNMIDYLDKLCEQFQYIQYGVDDEGQVTYYDVNRTQIKSARKIV